MAEPRPAGKPVAGSGFVGATFFGIVKAYAAACGGRLQLGPAVGEAVDVNRTGAGGRSVPCGDPESVVVRTPVVALRRTPVCTLPCICRGVVWSPW